ncbi:DUF6090 family protein [Seonamhaeicola sp. MEBiC1930]|uniref:DUF6090 family protein n=1 Tax=Seonamhaeicola sp. MEBiC01930 TaxID=2976768 RepID=UPI00325475A5
MIKFFRKIRQKLLSEGKMVKYIKYAIGEIVLVVIGILIALSINNWNQERINEKNIQGKLKLIHQELLEDIYDLEREIKNRSQKHQLISRSLDIIEQESSLDIHNRQVLDSSFLLYKRMEPLFNNTKSYEVFLSIESNFIDAAIYSKLNNYLDEFNEVNARIERMAQVISHPDFDILMNTSVKRKSSGEFYYSLKTIQQEHNLYEIMRHSKQYFNAITGFYSKVLTRARELDYEIKKN